MRRATTFGLILAAVLLFGGTSAIAEEKNPVVLMKTTKGDIKIELDSAKAPITTENFIAYTKDGFYDGTIFHRVIPGFMVQGGGFDKDMNQKPTKAPIKNESSNGLKNVRGSLSMARTSDPHSATSQFFINVVDNANLDQGDGYAVFARVTEGMDVVDAIVAVPTTTKRPHANVPVEPVIIESATVVE